MVELLEEIRKRKSGRAFSSQPVSQEMVESILEAGRWAPSCANKQSWRFVVITDQQALAKAHEAVSRGNAYGKTAPVMLLVLSREDDACTSHGLPYYMMDVGLATQNILLQAVHLGLMAHPTAGWEEEVLKQAFNIPEEYRIGTVIFIGYEGSIDDLDERTQEKERSPRTRKDLTEIVHYNSW
jgi:nitroreductase